MAAFRYLRRAVSGGRAVAFGSGRPLVGALALLSVVALTAESTSAIISPKAATEPPPTLYDTGLYVEDGSRVVDPAHLGFSPQYPLWTDGASKRRWISLPPGELIDASDADAWIFPIGTRFWKEFAFDGRPVETRYMVRLGDGSWLFATYVWDESAKAATLAPSKGIPRAFEFGDGSAHAVPSRTDCGVCHQSGRSPVLGFDALQLSDDRDANALHAESAPPPGLTLGSLLDRGLITGLDRRVVISPPRTSTASTTQRTALGYLHGNCGHCHNPDGPLKRLGLFLRHPSDPGQSAALSTTFGMPLVKPPAGILPDTRFRIAPGDPRHSAIPQRMAAPAAALQMPPIGTARVDEDAIELVNRWIAEVGIPPVPAPCEQLKMKANPILAVAALVLATPAFGQMSEEEMVKRGEYLVTTSACHDCHTPFKMGPDGPEPDMERALSGHPESVAVDEVPAIPEPWVTLAYWTNTAWAGPWGVSFTANLTPDPETGVLRDYTEEQFLLALRTGRHLGQGRPILPPMPWPVYGQMTDDDLKSIYAYLNQIPAIENKVPEPLPPMAVAD